jgi:tripartite-type tricarboxylate transporter receptor subunit TctC
MVASMRPAHLTLRWLLVACLAWVPPSFAQDFPAKPVRIIVPVQGGTMDLLARLVAPLLSETFGQPVLVETKAGAGGNIGTEYVAKSAPDGHTLLVGFNGPLAINVTLFDKLPFDPVRDLAPVTLAVSAPQFLVVHPSVPVSTVAELVAYAKAQASPMSYGSIGVGGASHLTMEMFKSAAGLELVHVPYKGSGPAVNDLLAGTVPMAFLVPGNVLPYMKAGRMKVLASTGRRRLASTPGVPTMIESGYPEFEAISWIGFLLPARTPRPIVERYNAELVRILKRPEVREKLTAIDFEVIGGTPEEFAALIKTEIVRWGEVIRKTGARAN